MATSSNISFNVSPSIYLGAARYAEKKGTNIESLLQEYLSTIADQEVEEQQIHAPIERVTKIEDLDSWTRQFIGVIHLDNNDINGRYAREEYLDEKYG